MQRVERAQSRQVLAGASVRRLRTRSAAAQQRSSVVGRHVLLVVFAGAFLLPFYWMVTSSLKETARVFGALGATNPIQWFPIPPIWSNYAIAWNYPGFPVFRLLGNSVFYAGMVTVGTVLTSTLVAYGFARLRFPGRQVLFGITLATMMIPSMVTFIPTYVLFKVVGDVLHKQLIGNYFPLIAPAFLGSAIFIFMMRQFFRRLPPELTEAARVDGAGEFRIFWQIMVPLVRPALLVVAMFSFLWTWHEFFGPLVYLSDNNQYPISLGLFRFKSRYVIDWGPMTAASTMATLPLIVMFFAAQRYFLEGVSLTGIKG